MDYIHSTDVPIHESTQRQASLLPQASPPLPRKWPPLAAVYTSMLFCPISSWLVPLPVWRLGRVTKAALRDAAHSAFPPCPAWAPSRDWLPLDFLHRSPAPSPQRLKQWHPRETLAAVLPVTPSHASRCFKQCPARRGVHACRRGSSSCPAPLVACPPTLESCKTLQSFAQSRLWWGSGWWISILGHWSRNAEPEVQNTSQ